MNFVSVECPVRLRRAALARLPDMVSRGSAMRGCTVKVRARPQSTPVASSSRIVAWDRSYTISGPYTTYTARQIRPIRLRRTRMIW